MSHFQCMSRAAQLVARRLLLGGALLAASAAATAQSPFTGWQAGAVVDLSATERAIALGRREPGVALGHSDVSVFGPLGPHLRAHASVSVHGKAQRLELEPEQAWVETRSLPAGLQLRAGRFASQIGYLNEQHPHADDFVERPLLYRAFLGNHWNDDGVRLNWTAPTDLYLRLGVEAFRGRRLVPDAASSRRPGALVLSGRTGGDLGTSQSWQAGLSLLHNRREAAVEAGHEGEEEDEHEEHAGHDHAHGAAFSGRRMWLGEMAWKWAPQGNNPQQQVRVSYEHALVRGLNRFAGRSDQHQAGYLSMVWRFAPEWEAGARADVLRVRAPHEGHFENERLRETALMLAYKPTHAQVLRLQLTRQRSPAGFEGATHAMQIQYVLNFGSHAAHAF
ncbi:MAG: hypothetical protein JWP65_230 [Ramlibacter sp.]|nr:hypothetical protein [Ramlibacter sp.]